MKITGEIGLSLQMREWMRIRQYVHNENCSELGEKKKYQCGPTNLFNHASHRVRHGSSSGNSREDGHYHRDCDSRCYSCTSSTITVSTHRYTGLHRGLILVRFSLNIGTATVIQGSCTEKWIDQKRDVVSTSR